MVKIEDKVILFHGFSADEAVRLMRLLKQNSENPEDMIFATTTESNLDWKVGELIRELSQEHQQMRKRKKVNPVDN